MNLFDRTETNCSHPIENRAAVATTAYDDYQVIVVCLICGRFEQGVRADA